MISMHGLPVKRRVTRAAAAALLAVAAACGPAPAGSPATPPPPSPPPPTPTSTPLSPTEPPRQSLPPEPIPVRFQAQDGQELEGMFYPGAEVPSPVVVLMHWIRSDQSDWSAVALWLQNRMPSGESPPGTPPWLDPSWFPRLEPERGYAVFTFTFRGCDGGCRGFEPEDRKLDARAALDAAAGQPGVDPMQVAAVGASIGGDAAIDACAVLSSESTDSRCVGALSLSPGGYLGMPYGAAVGTLMNALDRAAALPPAEAALCLASEGDADSAQACASGQGAHFQAIMYPGSAHGMELIAPSFSPNALSVIAGFLAGVTAP